MEKMCYFFWLLLAPAGVWFTNSLHSTNLTDWSLSVIDRNRQMVYPIICQIFFESAWHFPSTFQQRFPRWFCIINHLARHVSAKHPSCTSRLHNDRWDWGSVGVSQSVAAIILYNFNCLGLVSSCRINLRLIYDEASWFFSKFWNYQYIVIF